MSLVKKVTTMRVGRLSSRGALAPRTTLAQAVVVQPKKKQKRSRRLISPNQLNGTNRQLTFVRNYAESLQDPWEWGPMKLGYGTLVDTVNAVGYLRNNFTVNADGSFGIFMLPQLANMVYTNNAGAGVATWTAQSASNQNGISIQGNSGRVCSGGLRVYCLFPETSSSGVLFAGTVPGYTTTSLAATAPGSTGLAGFSTSELGIGRRGARAVLLPTDMTAFNMSNSTVANYPVGSYLPLSTPYVVGTGFPAGTVIWFEAVLNIELLPIANANGIGVALEHINDRASDYFVTPERLMSAASNYISQPVVMDAVQGLASMYSPILGNTIGRARSVFGGGANLRNTLASGGSSRRQGRENTVVIEEMKEDSQDLALRPRGSWF